jgi:hypothetical protein
MVCQVTTFTMLAVGLLGLLGGEVGRVAAAQPLSVRSTPHTVALLELYTSEGCNSCPQADSWVRALPSQGFRPDQVIPLALHVDYWDYLGWPDRFAQAIFTQRQRTIAALHRSRTIYTPQVVLQGKDFRPWDTLRSAVERVNRTPARAHLALQVTAAQRQELGLQISVNVPDPSDRPQAALYIALYENNLQSVVKAGENQGRTLHHDFVVRRWLGPVPVDEQGGVAYTARLSLATDWKDADLGVVVFVQQQHTGDVLQALALALGKQAPTEQ